MTYSRRRWLQSAACAALGWHLSDGVSAADRLAGKWSWRQLVPHSEKSDRIPVPRDPWNGMLSYKNSLYLFGGAFPRYGPPGGPGDLTTLGGLNDLWQFDVTAGRWNQVEADDGLANFDPAAKRPCGRVLPCWMEAGGKFYLFGGLAVTAVGWKVRLLNDLWSFDPATRHWTLLEPDDGRMLDRPTEVDGKRPGTIAAMGTAVIGNRVFIYAGWGGYRNKVVLSPQLWSFDVASRKWTLHGTGEGADTWPPKRYCPALTAYKGKLYLWGGRDTQDPSPQFYNDLWSYDPETNRWSQLTATTSNPVSGTRPSARYGMGHARVGHNWYFLGGFGNERGNSPQLNDLWRLDLRSGLWSLIEAHDGSKIIGPRARRPCVRRVPAMTALDEKVYLFGGLDLTSGPDERGPLIGFNDLWSGSPGH